MKEIGDVNLKSRQEAKLLSIVIPIYKTTIDLHERHSLQQCISLFASKYDIVFIAPAGLNIAAYQQICGQAKHKYLWFDKKYFSGIPGYNRLMLSFHFYNLFSNYKYMLIYQLDVYIFKDEMEYWCNKNYDYIGAPFVDWDWSTFYAGFLTLPRRLLRRVGYNSFNLVGNGGLSLRKISAFTFNLKLFRHAASSFKLNEDYFFSFYINSYNPFFKVAPFHDALKFSFDENPEKSFELNNRQLPMGCHAWPKYLDFWKKYIM